MRVAVGVQVCIPAPQVVAEQVERRARSLDLDETGMPGLTHLQRCRRRRTRGRLAATGAAGGGDERQDTSRPGRAETLTPGVGLQRLVTPRGGHGPSS